MNSNTLSSTSSALLVRRPDSEYAVTRRGSSAVTGPGRSLNQLYQSGGRRLGNVVDHFAHNLGLGPDAVSDRIQESFGSQQDRLLKLDELFGGNNCNLHALEKDCKILMKYALPLQSPMTQCQAFKNIVMLVTRYPGLRRLFLRCKHVQQEAPDVWIRIGENYNPKWRFFCQLAAHCVRDHVIAPTLEKTLPRELGLICERYGIIDELLAVLSCHKVSDIVACVAIRYLGGILEFSTFWVEKNHQRHRSVVEKLFKNAENMLRDVGVDSIELDGSVEDVPLDLEGVDILADVIIVGVLSWILQTPRSRLASEYWFGKFETFIHLLRWPNAEILTPRSWYHASTEKLQSVVPVAFEYKLKDVSTEVSQFAAEDQRPSPSHHEGIDVQPPAPTTTDRGAAGSISHDMDVPFDSSASNISTTSLVVPGSCEGSSPLVFDESESDAEDRRPSFPFHRKAVDVQPLATTTTDWGVAGSISHNMDITLDSTTLNVSTTSLVTVVSSGHDVSISPENHVNHGITTDMLPDTRQENERICDLTDERVRQAQEGYDLDTKGTASTSSPLGIGKLSATFASPEGFDVDALANLIEKSLQLLAPLCLSSIHSEHTFAKDLIARVREYAQAIDLSVVAAQSGFTVAEEAISLGDLIPTSTEKEHESHLIGMYELARDGHSNAAQTLQTFRDVCKKVLELLENVRLEHKTAMIDFSIHVDGRMTPMAKPFGALHSELHDGVGNLEQFANHIDALATWWNEMKIEGSALDTTQLIQFNYDSLRLKSVIKKWGDLRQQFATYISKISHIQDCYPTLFVKSLSARQTSKRDGQERALSVQQAEMV